ncbi:ubiquitin-conjugating enzyme E2 Z-like [Dermacentor silvarum]|uniref:ubiquitin-conjugating enzyme E2 Z-like n=1 Tax=Dermacentor silvarum TaxID=543639 RepID=UPI001897764B|nr:ubiquitin-conjugating enzyme E2 Z-like [Dermacentor silvarum]
MTERRFHKIALVRGRAEGSDAYNDIRPGPSGTPYDGGVFRYLLKRPIDFPAEPPRVRLMTTDAGRVWFAPNLNVDGMVCLSLLGTWPGPVWKSLVHIV